MWNHFSVNILIGFIFRSFLPGLWFAYAKKFKSKSLDNISFPYYSGESYFTVSQNPLFLSFNGSRVTVLIILYFLTNTRLVSNLSIEIYLWERISWKHYWLLFLVDLLVINIMSNKSFIYLSIFSCTFFAQCKFAHRTSSPNQRVRIYGDGTSTCIPAGLLIASAHMQVRLGKQ